MAIAIQINAYNGAQLTYGRLTDLVVDYQTREAKVTLSGFSSRESRRLGEKPISVLHTTFTMPDPVPENIMRYCYSVMAEDHPYMDFTEI